MHSKYRVQNVCLSVIHDFSDAVAIDNEASAAIPTNMKEMIDANITLEEQGCVSEVFFLILA